RLVSLFAKARRLRDVFHLAAEWSVLCPLCTRCVRFSMSVETSHTPSPVHRCPGLDRPERRCRPRPVQSSFRTRSNRAASVFDLQMSPHAKRRVRITLEVVVALGERDLDV